MFLGEGICVLAVFAGLECIQRSVYDYRITGYSEIQSDLSYCGITSSF